MTVSFSPNYGDAFVPQTAPFTSYELLDPSPPKEAFTRRWSNATQWPNGTLPKPSDVVIIPSDWEVMLDVSTEPLGMLIIAGKLSFLESK